MDGYAIVRALVAGSVLFACPGYALLVILKPRGAWGIGEKLCAAAGLSLVVVPLTLYASTYAGLELNPGAVVVLLLLASAVCFWDMGRWFVAWYHADTRKVDPVGLAVGAIFLLALGARLWMVQGIEYPLWTDSYHHTVIAQLIADLGRVPQSYQPYAPIDRFTYHFGFHSLAAWYHWLSGCSVARSVVIVGQWINALAVPTSYLLARRITKSPAAGLIAALVVGLLSHMPALYVNWGRYPQLSGLIALPVVMVLTMDVLEEPTWHLRPMVLTGITAAGLFLIHIRVTLFYALFVVVWAFFALIRAWKQHTFPQARRIVLNGLSLAAVALLLASPWLARFARGFGASVAQELSRGFQVERYGAYFQWHAQDLTKYGLRIDLLLLAGVGGVWGLIKKQRQIASLLVWLLALFAAANTYLLGIAPLFSNLIVIISLYLPGAVLIGYLGAELAALITRWLGGQDICLPSRGAWGLALVLMVIGLAGMGYTVSLIEPENGFVRPADLEAMTWIEQHVPDEALFHVDGQFWTPLLVHGLDAGYWLPLLASRQTTIPLETYGSDGSIAYRDAINRRARDLLAAETSQDLWTKLTAYGVSHIYIGARPSPMDPGLFVNDATHFQILYTQNDVWIFGVKP